MTTFELTNKQAFILDTLNNMHFKVAGKVVANIDADVNECGGVWMMIRGAGNDELLHSGSNEFDIDHALKKLPCKAKANAKNVDLAKRMFLAFYK